MPSVQRWPAWLLVGFFASVGCSGGNDFEPLEVVECEEASVDAEGSCGPFCEKLAGDCGDLFTFDEESCGRGCEANVREAYGCSEACGATLEDLFLCVAEIDDCDEVLNYISGRGDHACLSEVDDVGAVCEL